MSDHATHFCDLHGYDWVGHLGGGAFKEVFQIADSSGRFLALKLYREAGSTARNEREIDSLRRCNHPNIARLIDCGSFHHESKNYQFLLETFCGKQTLGDLLRSSHQFSSTELRRIGETLIDCLRHLESLRIVHRDIKPDNIMLDPSGAVHLVDFGLVRDLNQASLTHSWANMGPGTPFYAAPEQLRNEKALISWKTDQFSLAVTLCEILHGFHPFQNRTDSPRSMPIIEKVAARHSHGDLIAGSPLKEFFIQAANKWPIHRYASPEALLEGWKNQTSKL